MIHEYSFEVRGNELDSLNHVNNAVYLNYLEAARWKTMDIMYYNGRKWIDIIIEQKLYPVVTETRIQYLHELKLYDKAFVKSEWFYQGSFIILRQSIYKENSNIRVTKAIVKMVLVDNDKVVYEIPDFIKDNLNMWKNGEHDSERRAKTLENTK